MLVLSILKANPSTHLSPCLLPSSYVWCNFHNDIYNELEVLRRTCPLNPLAFGIWDCLDHLHELIRIHLKFIRWLLRRCQFTVFQLFTFNIAWVSLRWRLSKSLLKGILISRDDTLWIWGVGQDELETLLRFKYILQRHVMRVRIEIVRFNIQISLIIFTLLLMVQFNLFLGWCCFDNFFTGKHIKLKATVFRMKNNI